MGLSGSMVSCSRRRDAPAPAGAPRVAEWSSAALAVAERAGPAAAPPCRLWIASMSWLFRIRPTPVMPMDCATRCSSGSSMLVSPRPGGRAPSPGACAAGAEVVAAAVPDRGSGGSDRLRGSPGQIPGTGEELGGFAHEGSFPELRRRLREPVDPVLQPGELTGPSCAPNAAWRRLGVLCARGVQTTLVPPKTRARTGPQSTPFSPEPRVLSHFFKAISHAYSGGGEEAVRRFADRESPTTADHTAGNAADDGRALAPTAGHLVQHPA